MAHQITHTVAIVVSVFALQMMFWYMLGMRPTTTLAINELGEVPMTPGRPDDDTSMQSQLRGNSDCDAINLPAWVTGDPEIMAQSFKEGSQELSDKHDDGHRFFYAYQPYMAKMVLEKLGTQPNGCYKKPQSKPRFKLLEIGLGCHPKGGMKRGTPGGSALGWRSLFQDLKDVLDLDLHVMEYDVECATKWAEQHKDTAQVHTGDASSEADLSRVVQETGSSHDFDMIVDDASHINWHMIKTLETMMNQTAMGGIYVVEDIFSSCRNWRANIGTGFGEGTGGSRDCMTTSKGEPTFFAKVIEWQKELLLKRLPFVDVNHIDFHGQIVVFEKGLPQKEFQWKKYASAS